MPLKVEEAFKAYKYVPHIALMHSARLRVAWGEEDFLINMQGRLTAKGLNWQGERSIEIVEWQAATHTTEEHTQAWVRTGQL